MFSTGLISQQNSQRSTYLAMALNESPEWDRVNTVLSRPNNYTQDIVARYIQHCTSVCGQHVMLSLCTFEYDFAFSFIYKITQPSQI